jgi:hypothetical protein
VNDIISIDFPKNDHWLDGNPLPRGSDGWVGLEKIMPALVERFCGENRSTALELGVEFGYSTSVLAQLFGFVMGVDTFCGDEHSGFKSDHHELTMNNLKPWRNISLAQRDYRYFIKETESWPEGAHYSLIHVDMSHDYETTYTAGRWAVDHSPVVIFHDTESFPSVKEAVSAIAEETGRTFYNFREFNGLGILVKE